jgi:hypothetical protein
MAKTPIMHNYLNRDLAEALNTLYTPSIPEEVMPWDEVKPERSLVAALLSRAIEDAQGASMVTKQHRREARKWINEDTPNRVFTFSWCCIILDLEPFEIRQRLKANKYKLEAVRTDKGTLPKVVNS